MKVFELLFFLCVFALFWCFYVPVWGVATALDKVDVWLSNKLDGLFKGVGL